MVAFRPQVKFLPQPMPTGWAITRPGPTRAAGCSAAPNSTTLRKYSILEIGRRPSRWKATAMRNSITAQVPGKARASRARSSVSRSVLLIRATLLRSA